MNASNNDNDNNKNIIYNVFKERIWTDFNNNLRILYKKKI